jgi:hypothetical protein
MVFNVWAVISRNSSGTNLPALLEPVGFVEMMFEIELIVDWVMDDSETLETSHSPKFGHRALPPSRAQVRVLGSNVEPPTSVLGTFNSDGLHGGAIELQPVCFYCLLPPVSLHAFT